LLQTTTSVTIIIILGHGTKNKPLKRVDEPQHCPILSAFLPYISNDATILTVRRSAATYRQHAEGAIDTKFCMLLPGDSPASEIYMQTFRNTMFHLHRRVGMKNSS